MEYEDFDSFFDSFFAQSPQSPLGAVLLGEPEFPPPPLTEQSFYQNDFGDIGFHDQGQVEPCNDLLSPGEGCGTIFPISLNELETNQGQSPIQTENETDEPATLLVTELMQYMDNVEEEVIQNQVPPTVTSLQNNDSPIYRPIRPQTLNFRVTPSEYSSMSVNATATNIYADSPISPLDDLDLTRSHNILTPFTSPSPGDSSSDTNWSSDGSLTPGSPTSPTEVFICHVCQTVLGARRSLLRHYKRQHANCVSFPCRICQKPLSNPSTRLAHEKSHFSSEEWRDTNAKAKTKGFRETCPTCSKIFWDRTLFRRHETVHTEERPFSCHLCPNKRFKVKSSLKRHLKRAHSKEPPVLHQDAEQQIQEPIFPRQNDTTNTGFSNMHQQDT